MKNNGQSVINPERVSSALEMVKITKNKILIFIDGGIYARMNMCVYTYLIKRKGKHGNILYYIVLPPFQVVRYFDFG